MFWITVSNIFEVFWYMIKISFRFHLERALSILIWPHRLCVHCISVFWSLLWLYCSFWKVLHLQFNAFTVKFLLATGFVHIVIQGAWKLLLGYTSDYIRTHYKKWLWKELIRWDVCRINMCLCVMHFKASAKY